MLLLFSVIELIEKGVITSPKIQLSDAIVDTFNSNSRQLFQDDFFKPSIGQPFFFMKSESFCNLVAESTADLELKATSYSVKNLRSKYRYAMIDTEFFVLLQDWGNRERLQDILNSKYLITS